MSTFARKKFISNTSKIEVARTSLMCTYDLNHYFFDYAKIVCHSYLFHNFDKRVSLKKYEKVLRTLPFNKQDLIKLPIRLSIHESILRQSIKLVDGLRYKLG